MPLITLEKACLAFGHHALLAQVNLQLDPGERIGLIGRNGGGKSSLLRVLSGSIKLDDGTLWCIPSLKVAHVAQEPALTDSNSVYQEVSKGLGNISQLLLDYHAVSHTLSTGNQETENLLVRLQELQNELDTHDGWNIQARIETAIDKLNLPADTCIEHLSGGLRKRVALARALVMSPDVLLLDEPTNHLDFTSIEWLEEFLQNFSGSVLFVTHDRRFLDNIATRIVELDRGNLTTFPGNFSVYQRKKMEMLEIEATHNQKFDKILAQEEIWIRKGVQARCTRNEGRVRRLEALRKERTSRRERIGKANINVDTGDQSGNLVAELTHVSKKYGDNTIIDDFSCRIMRGDRIGLLGPNGAGKSTLLKLILGALQPDSGHIRQGTKLSIAYFDQMREQLNDEMTLAETVSQGSEFIEINGKRKHVISYLEDFLFSPQRARSPVKSLSGGERNRLLLARLFTRPANVMVLDEPTNDLDIETLELLEDLLQNYTGTLFLVSHDREFLDNVVTQVIAFEGNGILREYIGGYADWIQAKKQDKRIKEKQAQDDTNVKQPQSLSAKEKKLSKSLSQNKKLSYQETRELIALPDKIETLEQEQANIVQRLNIADIYQNNPDEAKILQKRYSVIEKEITDCLARWEELESKSSKIKGGL
ncbi:ATP-binding cassette domain-containing protein [Nitrosomonas aestuarii]|uniref:ATP-binding cassette domain-containing protein n=1 Tax=Nitrosomonas aestuarii TaxID=52441 RepID=UPI000D301E76|nr:ATP-binding cassette domain-containing protein [Nitrosomonas aestuarii]PTN10820.1 ATP-binding cassette subfamily F protein uup [Nitrosomonas aestuarii]